MFQLISKAPDLVEELRTVLAHQTQLQKEILSAIHNNSRILKELKVAIESIGAKEHV